MNDLYNPQRFEQIEDRHQNAFAWRRQDYIPLGIWVVNPEYAVDLDYGQWLEPDGFLDYQIKVLTDSLTVGSDLLPVIGINHLGTALLNTMFGAELFVPKTAIATLQDNGPTPLQLLESIEQVDQMNPPPIDSGLMPQVEQICRHYREHLPGWVGIDGPINNGPFSTAMELRGSGILMDLIDDPQRCLKLVNLIAATKVEAEHHLRRLLACPVDQFHSQFGIAGPGLRIGEDSICCLSPEMIAQFALPGVLEVLRLAGGSGYIHFCSLDHARYEQIYPVFRDCPDIQVISSQLAFEYYAKHLEELRGHLAIESLYAPGYSYVVETYGSFTAWADEFVPRFKNESGLVLYFQVDSVDEGRAIWDRWQAAHRK
ncbi:MAG: hypothetical protein QGF67_11915 [Lentisphaeria bacterium]|jgi:hypothetical protein|nr:hypothetical protein [Lentisphaeria bacterium]